MQCTKLPHSYAIKPKLAGHKCDNTYKCELVTLINTAISSNEFSASCSKSTLPLSALYLVDLVKAIWWLISHVHVAHKKIPFNPINFNFPSTSVGNRDHLFNPQWYDKYQCLEYSTSRDAIFCYPCCYFCTW